MTTSSPTKPATVEMTLTKSTAGTHVYQEDLTLPREQKTFPTVYVQKHVLSDPPPQRIRVTIEECRS